MHSTSELVNSLVGIPWKTGGRDIKTGVDCWGFFKYFYMETLGLQLHEYSEQPGDTVNVVRAFAAATGEAGEWRKLAAPTEYCAVALSMNRRIHHVGVWLNDGCVHATEGLGVVYNTLTQLKRNGYNRVEYYTCL